MLTSCAHFRVYTKWSQHAWCGYSSIPYRQPDAGGERDREKERVRGVLLATERVLCFPSNGICFKDGQHRLSYGTQRGYLRLPVIPLGRNSSQQLRSITASLCLTNRLRKCVQFKCYVPMVATIATPCRFGKRFRFSELWPKLNYRTLRDTLSLGSAKLLKPFCLSCKIKLHLLSVRKNHDEYLML